MNFSCVELNLRSQAARKDIANPYEMHRSLSRTLQVSEDERPRFLWRLEPQARHSLLYLQSEGLPDWSRLSDSTYLLSQRPAKSMTYWDGLQVGQIFTFGLKANPTVRKQGKRLGLAKLEDQMVWLQRQGDKNGFQLVGAMVSNSAIEQYRKNRDDSAYIRIRNKSPHILNGNISRKQGWRQWKLLLSPEQDFSLIIVLTKNDGLRLAFFVSEFTI